MQWEHETEENFQKLLNKVPEFLRDTAKEKVSEKATKIATSENRADITEKDLVCALFEATPFGFHGPLKADLEALGIDYAQYGFDK